MKVIDLLNKIANGEEVPKKIKWNNLIYEKSKYNATPRGCYYRINGGIKLWFLDEINSLTDEIEILEEKKIPGKLPIYGCTDAYSKFDINDNRKAINEIIDYLESKGE